MAKFRKKETQKSQQMSTLRQGNFISPRKQRKLARKQKRLAALAGPQPAFA
jgi:hypothetical protein